MNTSRSTTVSSPRGRGSGFDYFLKQSDRFKHYPWGVLAHCAHVHGLGTFENGVEKPRARVTLATQIRPEQCKRINLGYRDPAGICVEDFANREDEGILLVPKAGEMFDETGKRTNEGPSTFGFRISFVICHLSFMSPMHAKQRKEAFHEPARPSNCSLPWESGAEDARTPNAAAWSADSAASAKRLECVRFIGAFRLARDGQRFMVPVHAHKRKEAFHEPPTPGPLSPAR
jgi:hypothetical protein